MKRRKPFKKATRAHQNDFQNTLLEMAYSMVGLKRPERLLKMMTRFIDKELGVHHTALLVFDKDKKGFTFVDSKGSRRLPMGLIRFDLDHPLVNWFEKPKKRANSQDYLYRASLRFSKNNSKNKQSTDSMRVAQVMDDLKVELVIPGYYKKKLLGMLLLGKKKSNRCFTDAEISFFQVLVQECSMAIKTAEYQRHLVEKNEELEKQLKEIRSLRKKEQNTFYEILRSLAQEVYAKDAYTFGHVKQVERLGIMTAKEMKMDLSGRNKDILSAGLILHDVGKIGIPDHILNKPARLDPDEWKIMQTHVEKGAKILEHLTDFKEVAEIVWCHHENFDGTGYPRGIQGENIPIQSRIVSVVDAFHAIVSNRCYSKGQPIEFAFCELKRCAGTQFDPVVVEALVRAVKKEMRVRGVKKFLAEEEAQVTSLQEESLTAETSSL